MDWRGSARGGGRLERGDGDGSVWRYDVRGLFGSVAIQGAGLQWSASPLSPSLSLSLFPSKIVARLTSCDLLGRYVASGQDWPQWHERLHSLLGRLYGSSVPVQPEQEALHQLRRLKVGGYESGTLFVSVILC